MAAVATVAAADHAICVHMQERKQREKTTDKARREKARSKETKELSKGFYKGLMQDSDYQGEDYEVFSAWLGETE